MHQTAPTVCPVTVCGRVICVETSRQLKTPILDRKEAVYVRIRYCVTDLIKTDRKISRRRTTSSLQPERPRSMKCRLSLLKTRRSDRRVVYLSSDERQTRQHPLPLQKTWRSHLARGGRHTDHLHRRKTKQEKSKS